MYKSGYTDSRSLYVCIYIVFYKLIRSEIINNEAQKLLSNFKAPDNILKLKQQNVLITLKNCKVKSF